MHFFLRNTRKISTLLVLSLIFMATTPIMVTAENVETQPTIHLGTTANFAVLAGSAITNTGTTTINGGHIGLHPGTEFTGIASTVISNEGAIHLTDAVAKQAKDDLVVAYTDAVASSTIATTIATELGGNTLEPGVYTSADGTFQITGKLVLDSKGDDNAVFIFLMDSTLITASDSIIELSNGTRSCQVFWSVGSSATLGTNSSFVGSIFAMDSITATTGAMIQGQLLARNGAVTLDGNTITSGICGVIPPVEETATLHIIKHVINNNGGTSIAADFKIYIKHATSGIAVGNGTIGAENPGTTYTLPVGTYIISEDGSLEYASKFSGDSDANGKITLASGEIKTITITNDDIAVPIPPVEEDIIPTPPIVEEIIPTPPVVEEIIPEIPVDEVTTTVDGGKLPYTSIALYNLLMIGIVITLIGAFGWTVKKYNE